MHTIPMISILLLGLLSSGLGLNVKDTDLNPLSSNYEVVEENAEDFDSGPVEVDQISDNLMTVICGNPDKLIYVKEEEVIINCDNFFNEEKQENAEDTRKKREADEVEGSGNDEIAETTTETPSTVAETTTEKVTTVSAVEETTTEETTSEKATTTQTTTVETTTEQKIVLVPEVQPKEEMDTPKPEEIPKETEKPEEMPKETEKPEEQHEHQPKEDQKEKDVEDTDKKDPKKEVEVLKKGKQLIPHKQEINEENKDENGDPVQVKESISDAKKAGNKDMTILICMFAAVVVVGAAAFGYNFIKKRRQQSADLERIERSSMKNGTKPEAGEAEKKPLIGDNKEVEMVDLKKEPTVEESNEIVSKEPVDSKA